MDLPFLTSTPETRNRPCFLGIGCVWGWIYCAYSTQAIGFDAVESASSYSTTLLCVVIALFANAIILKGKDISSMAWMRIAAPFLMAASTFAIPFIQDATTPMAAIIAISCLIGCGFAWMCLLWGDVLANLDSGQSDFSVLGSSVITMLCAFFAPSFSGFIGLVFVAALLVASGAMLARARSVIGVPARDTDRSEFVDFGRPSPQMLVSIFVVLIVAYFTISVLDSSSKLLHMGIPEGIKGFDLAIFLGSSIGVVLALYATRHAIRIDLRPLLRWLAPALFLAIALWSTTDRIGIEASRGIGAAADVCIQAIAYLFFMKLAREGKLDICLGIGFAQGCLQLGVLAGELSARYLATSYEGDAILFANIGFALIVLLSLSTAALPESYPTQQYANSNRSTGESSPDEIFNEISLRYMLSARESEILSLLAKGRSQPYIQEILFLSKSTVSTHVKHIYKKLGVHSKQELLNLVDDEKRRVDQP